MKTYTEFLENWRPGHIPELDGVAMKPDNAKQLINQLKHLGAWTTAMAMQHPEKHKLMEAREHLDAAVSALEAVENDEFSPYSKVPQPGQNQASP